MVQPGHVELCTGCGARAQLTSKYFFALNRCLGCLAFRFSSGLLLNIAQSLIVASAINYPNCSLLISVHFASSVDLLGNPVR